MDCRVWRYHDSPGDQRPPWPEREREKTSRVGPLPQLSCNPRPRILLQASAVMASGSGSFSGVSARIQLATRHSLPLKRVFPWWDGRFLISYPLKVEQFPQSLLWHLWYFFFPMPTNVRTHTSQVPLCQTSHFSLRVPPWVPSQPRAWFWCIPDTLVCALRHCRLG